MQNRCKKRNSPPLPPDLPPTRMKNTTTRKKKTWLPRGEVNEPKPHATRVWEPPRDIHRETDDDDPQTKIARRRKTTRMQRKNETSKRVREVHSASSVAWGGRREREQRVAASNPASHTHQYAFHSSTFILHHFPLQSSNPLFSVLNGNREHTPEVIRPVLKAGNHGSEKPKEPVQKWQRFLKTSSKNQSGYLTTVLKIREQPVWIYAHDQGSQAFWEWSRLITPI